jgi:hypothetical protein
MEVGDESNFQELENSFFFFTFSNRSIKSFLKRNLGALNI